MADAIRISTTPARQTPEQQPAGPVDPGGWLLMLVPAGICVVMFLVAAWW